MSNTQDFNNEHSNSSVEAGPAEAAPITPQQGANSLRSMRYWLRAVDTLLARELDARFAEAGASRRDLRMLTMLAAGDELPEKKRARLERHANRLWALADRGWIVRSTQRSEPQTRLAQASWELTTAGEAALDRLQQIAQSVREQVEGAVSEEAFTTTTESLKTIAEELGWTGEMRLYRGRRGPGRSRAGWQRGHGHGHGHGHSHSHHHNRGRGFERGFAAGFTAARSRG